MISQFSEEKGHRTLAEFGFPQSVYPVGRLDVESEGLLLLSDDTRFNKALLDPINQHERTYWVQVDGIPDKTSLHKLSNGITIQGRETATCHARLLEPEPDLPPRPVPIRFRKDIPTSWISITLTEGKNRQVRKMTAAVGHPTLRLVRWAIGNMTIADLDLAPGEWRRLKIDEVKRLFERKFAFE